MNRRTMLYGGVAAVASLAGAGAHDPSTRLTLAGSGVSRSIVSIRLYREATARARPARG